MTTCQASEEQNALNRRGLLTTGLSLAAATQLQVASPADAVVVSKEWEKVSDGLVAKVLGRLQPDCNQCIELAAGRSSCGPWSCAA